MAHHGCKAVSLLNSELVMPLLPKKKKTTNKPKTKQNKNNNTNNKKIKTKRNNINKQKETTRKIITFMYFSKFDERAITAAFQINFM